MFSGQLISEIDLADFLGNLGDWTGIASVVGGRGARSGGGVGGEGHGSRWGILRRIQRHTASELRLWRKSRSRWKIWSGGPHPLLV
jgi:hypothetical protein